MTDLKPGWYWVMYMQDTEWEVARWSGQYWLFTNDEHWYEFDEMDKVGDRILCPHDK